MSKIKKPSISSPHAIFFLYILASGIVIMAFRMIFPGESAPLKHFAIQWGLVKGFIEFLNLFPALVLSSLVIPFSLKIQAREKHNPFSSHIFESFKMHIVTAIIASALYALLFSLALPLARTHETNLSSRGLLYTLAKERAHESASSGEWAEVSQLVAICERIWPKSPEVSNLKTEAEIRTNEGRLASSYYPEKTEDSFRSNPVSASDAIAKAESALNEERFFDAHWLASLAGQIAKPDSPELTTANRLAGRAWSGINSLAPNARETRAFQIYRLKRDGYEALIGQEWIKAYYIFLELLTLSPEDPDVPKYFAHSEDGVKRSAFFMDEIELALGKILSGAVFSFPLEDGRMVMRVSSLLTSPDYAYGIETEIMAFDMEGRAAWSMTVPYIKFLPITLNSGSSLTILLRALDREDKTKRWEPSARNLRQRAPNTAQITLPVSWNTFLLLSEVRRGLSGLSIADLRRAAKDLEDCGYLPQVFEAETLERFAQPLLLLPLGIFTIAIGWQYRALKRPRYMGIPMLGILPVVFNGIFYLCRVSLKNLEILSVVSLGFTIAALFFAIGLTVLLVLSLIALASRHG